MQKVSNFIVSLIAGAIGSLLTIAIVLGLVRVYPNQALDLYARLKLPSFSSQTADSRLQTAQPVTAGSGVVETVKRANPAVVSIIISKDVPVLERYFESQPLDPFFGDIFGDIFDTPMPRYREKGKEKREIGGGSGFLVSKDGYVITNKHVVQDEQAEYTVFTNDGKKRVAKVVARDPSADIAMLKIEGDGYSFLEFGDSDKIDVGQTAIAIGNALGEFRNTVSVGVISGLSRSITAGDGQGMAERLEGVIQTDAAINPGNSGGPLLDLDGKVVGINVAVAGGENIGFALPSNLVKSVVKSVREKGRIVRPFLGVRYLPITEELKQKNRLSVDYGVLIARGEKPDELAVQPGSAADRAGLMENDIILEVDGKKITAENTLAALIRNRQVGDKIKLKILHKGEEKTIEATLQEIPQ